MKGNLNSNLQYLIFLTMTLEDNCNLSKRKKDKRSRFYLTVCHHSSNLSIPSRREVRRRRRRIRRLLLKVVREVRMIPLQTN